MSEESKDDEAFTPATLDTEKKRYILEEPVLAPFGIPVTAVGVQEVWDEFVKKAQEDGHIQSVEERALMGILRAVYQALIAGEIKPEEGEKDD